MPSTRSVSPRDSARESTGTLDALQAPAIVYWPGGQYKHGNEEEYTCDEDGGMFRQVRVGAEGERVVR